MKREEVVPASEDQSTADGGAEVPIRIAIIISHPIQYFAPYYRALGATPGVILKVFFCRKWGAETYYDVNFRKEVKWDIPLLEGYESEFLDSRNSRNSHCFWQIDNPSIGEALSKFRPDIVEVCGYTHPTIWRAVNWCKSHGVPSVLYSDSNASAQRAFWRRALKAIVVKPFYRRIDGALASGDNNRTYHLRYGLPAERVYTRAMPIDCDRMVLSAGDVSTARREIRQKHGIPENAFVVIYAGKLSSIKCPLHLLQAVHLCAQQGHTVWGLLVGEGVQRPLLEEYIAQHQLNNVVLAGFVNQSAIAKYYAASEVVTLMSSYEPKGQIVPEAGSLSCPAIVSDHVGCIGPNDCARPGENALVYPWGDVDAFAKCIVRVYEGRELYRAMSEAAVRIANLQDASVAAAQMKEAAMKIRKIGCRR